MRIRFEHGVFFAGDNPIPPGFIFQEEAELVIRLRSTRSGRNARWEAGQTARQAMNGAPFEPVLRAVVDYFYWQPPDTRDCQAHFDFMVPLADNEVRQYGSAVPNWRAFVLRPLEDPLRPLFDRVWTATTSEPRPVKRQGHLEVYALDNSLVDESESMVPRAGSGNRWYFNHCLIGISRFAWRVPTDTRQAVALVKADDGIWWILSPDHPDQPIMLGGWKFGGSGWYVLIHPLPQPKGVD